MFTNFSTAKFLINRKWLKKRKRSWENPTHFTTGWKALAWSSEPSRSSRFIVSFFFFSFRNSDRSEKKTSHDPIPVPYRTAKAFEPAIYRNVAYDVYMNDHFKKYLDRSSNKQHQHIPFMAHNRLVERFGRFGEKFSRPTFVWKTSLRFQVWKCICPFPIWIHLIAVEWS